MTDIRLFSDKRVVTMLFLGFSAGIPILLIFSTLGVWLREASIERATVTMFSWAALGYSFKFVWAPLVDRLPVPMLSRLLGRRRAWIFLSQISICIAIIWMGSINPATGTMSLTAMSFAAILLGFSSANQDIVIDAYRIESGENDLQALMSSTYIAGYRIGMLVAGAGALVIAHYLGTSAQTYRYEAWQYAYYAMAAFMVVGIVTTVLISEPEQTKAESPDYSIREYLNLVGLFVFSAGVFIFAFWVSAGPLESAKELVRENLTGNTDLVSFIGETVRLAFAIAIVVLTVNLARLTGVLESKVFIETYWAPVREFFFRFPLSAAITLIALIATYRISDILLGVIANIFYIDMGFSKLEIASVVKTFGLLMTIAGGFIGGLLSIRFGLMRVLLLAAVLTIATNLLFVLLAQSGYNLGILYVVISADSLTAGLASAAFVAFLSSLTSTSFTATQYAIFSSLMTLFPKVIGGYSGSIVDSLGYSNFFVICSLAGVPVLFLILMVIRQQKSQANKIE